MSAIIKIFISRLSKIRSYYIYIIRAVLLIFISITFTFCSNEINDTSKTRTVFRYNESKGIASLDPAYSSNQSVIWPINQLFNGLVQLDSALIVKPCIAHSWEILDEGKCYRFYLRSDVKFHDHHVFDNGEGRLVNASDFVYSLNRISDPSIASPGAWIFNNLDREKTNDNSGIRAINDTTLEIYIIDPFPAFLSILSMKYCSVVPFELVAHFGKDFRSNPVGTGPFYFKMWVEDEKLVLRKYENYFELDDQGQKLPYLDAIAITFIKDKQSEFMEFIKGNIDLLSGLHAGYKDELLNRDGKLNSKYHDRFYLLTEPFLNTEYLAFMIDPVFSDDNNPLLNKKVRQAINFGFDRKKMISYLRNNIGTPAYNGIIPAGLPSFNNSQKTYSYNPELSLELLNESGFPNGLGLPEITLTTNSDYLDISEYIQFQLSEIGFSIKIDIGTGPSFREMVAKSKLEFFRASWIADYPDGQNYLALFYSKNHSPAGPNYTHYSNPEFDILYEKSMFETNDSLRWLYYRQMDIMISEDAVIVPLFYDQVVRFVSKNIADLGSNPMNSLELKRVSLINKH